MKARSLAGAGKGVTCFPNRNGGSGAETTWRSGARGHTMVEMSVLRIRRSALLALIASFACSLFGADAANVAELRRGFERPPDDARMMVRWWWFGPSVTKAELEREMRFMKEGGIGGF